MQYTNTIPASSGYYWLKESPKKPCIVYVDYVIHDEICVHTMDGDNFVIDNIFSALWAGPLEPPTT